jgi:hypothetical protein
VGAHERRREAPVRGLSNRKGTIHRHELCVHEKMARASRALALLGCLEEGGPAAEVICTPLDDRDVGNWSHRLGWPKRAESTEIFVPDEEPYSSSPPFVLLALTEPGPATLPVHLRVAESEPGVRYRSPRWFEIRPRGERCDLTAMAITSQ